MPRGPAEHNEQQHAQAAANTQQRGGAAQYEHNLQEEQQARHASASARARQLCTQQGGSVIQEDCGRSGRTRGLQEQPRHALHSKARQLSW